MADRGTDWLGGQLTAQGVSALDEHEHIEYFGGTARYYGLRKALRDHYRGFAGEAGREPDFNPGSCWVTRLAFEPRVAVAAIDALLQPFVDAGRLRIARRMKTIAVTVEDDRITAVLAIGLVDRRMVRFHPAIVIDATELGDLLLLAGAEYVVGAETVADTGEPHAQPVEPKPRCVQSFTYTFAAERRPAGESHIVPQPEKYAHYRDGQPFSLTIEVHGGEIYGEESGWLEYKLFDTMPGTKGPLFTYRRLVDARQFGDRVAHDLTLFNWPGNDYRDESLIDRPAPAVVAALQDAKRVSLGFFRWLQTEAPTEGTRRGAPELRLRPDVMGSADGLCKFPYIANRGASRRSRPSSSTSCRPTARPARARRISATRSESAGIRSTSTGRGRRMSARAVGRGRSRFRSARSSRSGWATCWRPARTSARPCDQRLLSAASGRMEYRRGRRHARRDGARPGGSAAPHPR
ncbi:MAG: FAD-dependent oxidoreductase [Pseudomonadota bacterium]